MVKTAVILAAGMGTRLGNLSEDSPKGFLKVGDRTLIERSLHELVSRGMTDIVLGVGYRHQAYAALKSDWPQIRCIENSAFKTTGSFYTLGCVLSEVEDDILLLESDLLYDGAALDALLSNDWPSIVLGSDMTSYGDEVFLEVNQHDHLVGVSKKKSTLNSTSSILVGINKLSKKVLQHLIQWRERHPDQSKTIDYESVLPLLPQSVPIKVLHLQGLNWCEIDNKLHYERAVHDVLPHLESLKP